MTQDALVTLTLMVLADLPLPAAGRGGSHSPAAAGLLASSLHGNPTGLETFRWVVHPSNSPDFSVQWKDCLLLASPPMCHLVTLAALDVGCMGIFERRLVNKIQWRRQPRVAGPSPASLEEGPRAAADSWPWFGGCQQKEMSKP